MSYGLSVSTAPAVEPVSVAEAQTHLRVDTGTDDTYIGLLVASARVFCEDFTGRKFVTQTLKLSMDTFPPNCLGAILLPRSPVQSVTSIVYTDTNGDSQTLDASKYDVDVESIVPRIVPAYGESWPSVQPGVNRVTVLFVAGYGLASSVPDGIKHAIKLLVGTYYDPVRATVITGESSQTLPHATEYLLGPYKVGTIGGTGTWR